LSTILRFLRKYWKPSAIVGIGLVLAFETVKGAFNQGGRIIFERWWSNKPSIVVAALWGHQGISLNTSFTDNNQRGFSNFEWNGIFEFHNMGKLDITLSGFENVFQSAMSAGIPIVLKQREVKNQIIRLYEAFGDWDDHSKGETHFFPYTLKAGTKKYIEYHGDYFVVNALDQVQPLFCRDEQQCYKILTASLSPNAVPLGDGTCLRVVFKIRIDFVEYQSVTTEQETSLLYPGCMLDLSPLSKTVPLKK
jgi:hypothetical protein